MATLILTAVGSMFGPVGGAIGALAGRTIDSKIFGPGGKEGPRLKELTVSGSSYGTPIARHFGAMRVPGTIIWSTDFKENETSEGGSKGKPSTTTYSYSVSFAVALASRHIDRIGRIWADGNLLRGADGDLKTGGTLRVHQGTPDQGRDPLMQAALGSKCPAYRGMAYAVFEDLDLTDFGNRIPALSFEVFSGTGSAVLPNSLVGGTVEADGSTQFPELAGFSHEGGTLRDLVGLVGRLNPVTPLIEADTLRLASARAPGTQPIDLPEAAAWDEGDFGTQSGLAGARTGGRQDAIASLRYYDPERDYQPGMQYVSGGSQDGASLEFPGAFAAGDAGRLARHANRRSASGRDAVSYRIAELDPGLAPGALVKVPGRTGTWQVRAWEWRARGVELELVRFRPEPDLPAVADPGLGWYPSDRSGASTSLRVFELPWDGTGAASARRAYAAIGAGEGRWAGARLYSQAGGVLSDTGSVAGRRAVGGHLTAPLGKSTALRFEPDASLTLSLENPAHELVPASTDGLAMGRNRALVGSEVLQFAGCDPLGGGAWRLTGLLRGRGGTEKEAGLGHAAGSAFTLLDERLLTIDANVLTGGGTSFVGLGPADESPAAAELESPGASLAPPAPVHARFEQRPDGSLEMSWVRRARGGWAWLDQVEQPLVEQSESYEVGVGPVGAPLRLWATSHAGLALTPEQAAQLLLDYPGAQVWVRQIGTFAKSGPALLARLP